MSTLAYHYFTRINTSKCLADVVTADIANIHGTFYAVTIEFVDDSKITVYPTDMDLEVFEYILPDEYEVIGGNHGTAN